ncbi:MAG: hypothetical protein ACMG6E_10720 [Candidatus Roizmanbacteria bacterium]
MSPKQFRQVLSNFGFTMSDDDLQSLIKTYGNEQNDIKYQDFLNDSNPYKGMSIDETLKTPYQSHGVGFSGESELHKLLYKIKNQVKKDRIRLLEFF